LNIPIIPKQKKINLSYSVILRNIISKTAQRITKAIDYFKNSFSNLLSLIEEYTSFKIALNKSII